MYGGISHKDKSSETDEHSLLVEHIYWHCFAPINKPLGRPSIFVKDIESYQKLIPGLVYCEMIQNSNSNSFPMSLEWKFVFFNFNIWIKTFPYYNVSRIENFEIQTTYYFEYYLEPRIWEIVPDCIKKVTALRILNWK